jgi:hypothetical protein
MLKLASLGTALVFGIAAPPGGDSHGKPMRERVEQALLQQMNSGPDGRITRSVHCHTAGSQSKFSCVLESTRSTTLGAVVVAHGVELQTAWEPLQG